MCRIPDQEKSARCVELDVAVYSGPRADEALVNGRRRSLLNSRNPDQATSARVTALGTWSPWTYAGPTANEFVHRALERTQAPQHPHIWAGGLPLEFGCMRGLTSGTGCSGAIGPLGVDTTGRSRCIAEAAGTRGGEKVEGRCR